MAHNLRNGGCHTTGYGGVFQHLVVCAKTVIRFALVPAGLYNGGDVCSSFNAGLGHLAVHPCGGNNLLGVAVKEISQVVRHLGGVEVSVVHIAKDGWRTVVCAQNHESLLVSFVHHIKTVGCAHTAGVGKFQVCGRKLSGFCGMVLADSCQSLF